MNDEACLYAAIRAPRSSHDRLLREAIAPLVRGIEGQRELDSFFFIRYDDPEWQLRFRVLGRPAWIEGEVRERVQRALAPHVADGTVTGVEYGEYVREWERYGGREGMRLAEQVFHRDSLACLALLEAEQAGETHRTRREYSLLFAERLLDLFGFTGAERRAFYRSGHDWAFRDGVFRAEDAPRLTRQYDAVRDGLRELLEGEQSRDPELQLGGAVAARIARDCLEATRPIAEEIVARHERGTIHQDLVSLVWSYAHLHCNRLGIELVPEAILRYLMFRYYDERSAAGPSS